MTVIAVAVSCNIVCDNVFLFESVEGECHRKLNIGIWEEVCDSAVFTEVKREEAIVIFDECNSLFSYLKSLFSVFSRTDCLLCFFKVRSSIVENTSVLLHV